MSVFFLNAFCLWNKGLACSGGSCGLCGGAFSSCFSWIKVYQHWEVLPACVWLIPCIYSLTGDNGEDEYDNDASGNDACKEEDSSDDEPYFSMVSGTYVSKPVSLKSSRKAQETKNLESLPGKGQMTEYKSEAAEFWKKREYKGLEAKIGKDDAKAAVQGQTGIASDYGKWCICSLIQYLLE